MYNNTTRSSKGITLGCKINNINQHSTGEYHREMKE